MDLVTLAPRATAEERAAVDAVLGPPVGRWDGGYRAIDHAGARVALGGHEARERRDLLLPVLHGIQHRIGWISQSALEYACRRLSIPPADAHGVAAFYAMFATVPRPPIVAHVCEDLACRAAGSQAVCDELAEWLGPEGAPALDGRVTWLRTPCIGRCERAPAALFTVAGTRPEVLAVAPIDAEEIARRIDDAVAGRSIMPPPNISAPTCAASGTCVGRSPRRAIRDFGCCAGWARRTRPGSRTTRIAAAVAGCAGRSRSAGRP